MFFVLPEESPTEVTDNTLIIILCCTIIPIGVAAMVAGIVLGIQKNKTKYVKSLQYVNFLR